jgi:phage repressor protein C with HTH and peptisase S24 domain
VLCGIILIFNDVRFEVSKLGDALLAARKEKKLSRAALSKVIGYSAPAIRRVEDGEVVEPHNLAAYAEGLGLDVAALEKLVEEDRAAAGAVAERGPRAGWRASLGPNAGKRIEVISPARGEIPVLGRAAAGELGKLVMLYEVAERIPTPASLDKVDGAYAVYVAGTSMEPRYFAGELVHVNPNRPVARNEFCVVQIGPPGQPPEEGYIKQFVSMDAGKLKLRQYNPPMEIEFDTDKVHAIHLIVGTARV